MDRLGELFIIKIKVEIVKNAINAVFIKSVLIPTFSNKPITLRGIPNLIKGIEIFSEALGLYLPITKPISKKGIMFIKSVLIVLNLIH